MSEGPWPSQAICCGAMDSGVDRGATAVRRRECWRELEDDDRGTDADRGHGRHQGSAGLRGTATAQSPPPLLCSISARDLAIEAGRRARPHVARRDGRREATQQAALLPVFGVDLLAGRALLQVAVQGTQLYARQRLVKPRRDQLAIARVLMPSMTDSCCRTSFGRRLARACPLPSRTWRAPWQVPGGATRGRG